MKGVKGPMPAFLVVVTLLGPTVLMLPATVAAQDRLPIIDMHLHARDAPDPERKLPPRLCLPVTVYGATDPRCNEPLVAPATDEAMVERTVEILERRNVFGVISYDSLETVRRFVDAAPDRLIPGFELNGEGDPPADEVRRRFKAEDRDAHSVIDKTKNGGVYVFGGGIDEDVPPVLVSADGSVAEGGYPWAPPLDDGFSVLELPSREAAVAWATRIAKAYRCEQELRAFGFDP